MMPSHTAVNMNKGSVASFHLEAIVESRAASVAPNGSKLSGIAVASTGVLMKRQTRSGRPQCNDLRVTLGHLSPGRKRPRHVLTPSHPRCMRTPTLQTNIDRKRPADGPAARKMFYRPTADTVGILRRSPSQQRRPGHRPHTPVLRIHLHLEWLEASTFASRRTGSAASSGTDSETK